MDARIREVQKRLWWLCLGSLLLAFLIRPQPENRRYVNALAELESFGASFVRKQAEGALQKQALGRGEFSFARVQEVASTSERAPKLRLGEDLSPPRALSFTRLASLADAHAYAEPGASLQIGLADAEALGQGLAWRMGRSAASGTFTLRAFELVAAEVTEADVARERRLAELHRASLSATSALDEASRKLENAELRVEKRHKRRSSSAMRFIALRDNARDLRDEKAQQQLAAQTRFEQAAQEAAHAYKKSDAQGKLPKLAIARVTLESPRERTAPRAAKGKIETYEIPVLLTQRRVSVPLLRDAEFSALRAAGLWHELSGLDADHAADALQSRFNWHLRTVALLGLSFSGAKLLSLLPCLLAWLLAQLALHIRRAESCYSPFTSQVPSTLPRVGFKRRWVELVAVVLLPLVPVISASVSLWQINQLPILPALSGLACLSLGWHSFIKLDDLRNQAISIVRAHSYPPPAHDLSLSP